MWPFMVGTLLYGFVSILPFGLFAIYSLSKEGWMSTKGPVEKFMCFALPIGIAYQIILPFYWIFVLAPQSGIPYPGF